MTYLEGEDRMESDTLLFFNRHPAALGLYEELERWLQAAFPEMQKRVQKTQISFYQRYTFACVSFARVKKKAELTEPWLTFTLGLPTPLDSPRAAVQSQPYPGRWTVHILLHDPGELDAELLTWTKQAYAFSQQKP